MTEEDKKILFNVLLKSLSILKNGNEEITKFELARYLSDTAEFSDEWRDKVAWFHSWLEQSGLVRKPGVLAKENCLAVARVILENQDKKIASLQNAVMNKCGDDLCWVEDPNQAKALPESEFLESCRRYRNQIASERGELDVGQMTIAQLESRILEPSQRLYCATGNPHKLREFKSLGDVREIKGFDKIIPCVEDGLTFKENAAKKAVYYSDFATGFVFSDDSGVEVEALGGDPGVLSARYAATSKEAVQKLLYNLHGKTPRSARFTCCVAVARGGILLQTFEKFVHGEILETPRGADTFGYDPVFFCDEAQKSFGEMDEEEKNKFSARGAAFRAMMEWAWQRS